MRNLSTLVGGVGGAIRDIPAAFSPMLFGLAVGRYGVGVMKYHSLYMGVNR